MNIAQFLKFNGFVATGGEAKNLIKSKVILVNGCQETRRGRKLVVGDVIVIDGIEIVYNDHSP